MDAKLDQLAAKLDLANSKLDQLLKGQQTEMADLSKLQADVTQNQSVVDSAVTLLQGLKAALDAAGTDPAALAALSSSLETQTAALAAAVAANTPSSPTPTAP